MSSFPTTINTAKEYAESFAPLFLVNLVLTDGTEIDLASIGLNSTEGYVQYGGKSYLGKILNQSIPAVQGMSEYGVDIFPSVTLQVADADATLFVNYEIPIGFTGAIMTVNFLLWQPGTSNFSSNSLGVFSGVCSQPKRDEATGQMEIYAVSKLNMQKRWFPLVHIQNRCPWTFPQTAAQRLDGVNNPYSPFYKCGYSPDVAGANARGNYQTGTTPYTTCAYTRSDCVARGMFSYDSVPRQTGRFGGIEYMPPQAWHSKSYVEGKTIIGYNTQNLGVFNQYIPMIYGSCMLLNAPVTYISGDGNSTHCECLLGVAYVGSGLAEQANSGITMFIVDDTVVPPNTNTPDNLFWYALSQAGYHEGKASHGPGFTDSSGVDNGDPHGNIACIMFSVPRELHDSQSAPSVRIIIGTRDTPGVWIRVPSDTNPAHASSWNQVPSDNPAYIVFDALMNCAHTPYELNIQSFIDVANFCATNITYKDLTGATATHKRFTCGFQLQEKTSAGEAIRGILNSFNGYLVKDSGTGLLTLYCEQSLADQQSSPISGSNYNTAITSVHANGTTANGYAAYSFDESNIIRDTLKLSSISGEDLPNTINISFQDEDNHFQQDSVSMVDEDAYAIDGKQNEDAPEIIGLKNFDQAARIANVMMAKYRRGNPRDDPKGSWIISFTTTIKAAHLRAGHIVCFSWWKFGLTRQLFRILSIAPTTDGQRWELTLRWHRDEWYEDAFGQDPAPFYNNPGNSPTTRLPYPWQPGQIQTLPNDTINGQQFQFAITQSYTTNTDGTAQAQINIKGNPVVNVLATDVGPPHVPLQGSGSSTGGILLPGSYCVALASVNSSGKISGKSSIVKCLVPASTTTGSVTVPNIYWQNNADRYFVFIGTEESNMTATSETPLGTLGTGAPTSITVTQMGVTASLIPGVADFMAPPDVMFDHFRIRAKQAAHTGCWGAQIAAVDASTITITGANWTTNQWAGRWVALIARADGSGQAPVAIQVASNTANVLTMTHPFGAVSSALNVGDIIVIRSQPTAFTTNTITDANWISNTPGGSSTGLAVNAEVGNVVHIVAGKGAGQWRNIVSNTSTQITVDKNFDPAIDATSVFFVEAKDWKIDVPTTAIHCSTLPTAGQTGSIATVNVQNLAGLPIVVQVLTADKAGNLCLENYAPVRDTYLFGNVGTTGGGTSPIQSS